MYNVHGWRHFLVCNTHHLELLAPFPKWKSKFTWGKTWGVPIYCISDFVCFGEETWNCMHFLVILSLKTLWAGVKRWRTALHRFRYTGTPNSSPVIKKMCTFEVLLFCVWCLDNWSRILSGKPFNTFSMARLNILQLCLTITPLFTTTGSYYINPCYHAWHAFFFLFNHFPPMICDKGIFFYSRDPPLFFFFFFFFFVISVSDKFLLMKMLCKLCTILLE